MLFGFGFGFVVSMSRTPEGKLGHLGRLVLCLHQLIIASIGLGLGLGLYRSSTTPSPEVGAALRHSAVILTPTYE